MNILDEVWQRDMMRSGGFVYFHIIIYISCLFLCLFQYEMEVSFLEIYNETIRDLIRSGRDDVKHTIKMKAADSTEFIVTNLTVEKVTKPSQVSLNLF